MYATGEQANAEPAVPGRRILVDRAFTRSAPHLVVRRDLITLEDLIMRRTFGRNLTLVVQAVAAVLLAGLLASSHPAWADDDAKPAKKDNPASLKPSQATLSASVEPADAKPGDVVTFKVTAKLDPGFHIYKYSKEQGGGPVPTSFDFFGHAGLEVDGDWTASHDPQKHKDPNFPDVESVEYYEDEVTWSMKLRIPAGTGAGKETLRCQARYMICDAKTCSIPGRWTLPDVELTIKDGEPAQPAAAGPADAQPAAKPALVNSAGTKPAKKDSNAVIRPAQATFSTSVEPARAKPGDVVSFKVTAKLEPGWHVYQYAKVASPAPVSTGFDFFDRGGLELEGDWTASRDPVKRKDPNFEEVPFVEYFEDEVTWSAHLKVPAGATAGKKTLSCQVHYMICNASSCSQPVYVTLPSASLTVAASESTAPRDRRPRRSSSPAESRHAESTSRG